MGFATPLSPDFNVEVCMVGLESRQPLHQLNIEVGGQGLRGRGVDIKDGSDAMLLMMTMLMMMLMLAMAMMRC